MTVFGIEEVLSQFLSPRENSKIGLLKACTCMSEWSFYQMFLFIKNWNDIWRLHSTVNVSLMRHMESFLKMWAPYWKGGGAAEWMENSKRKPHHNLLVPGVTFLSVRTMRLTCKILPDELKCFTPASNILSPRYSNIVLPTMSKDTVYLLDAFLVDNSVFGGMCHVVN